MTWKFRQIKPQKARGKFTEDLWENPAWLAEEKFDGERRIAQFCGGAVRFTSCRESVDGTGYVEKSRQVPHLSLIWALSSLVFRTKDLLNRVKGLDGTVLDGEMVPPPGTKIKGGGSKYVTSIMGSSPEEAVRKQRERGYLCYKVFDCLWWKGKDIRDMPFGGRQTYVHGMVKEWANPYVSVSLATTRESEKYRIYKAAAEGVVFKNINSFYGDEKSWVKHKKAWTADVVITGFTKGKGKYLGQIGAIEFGQHYKVSLKAGSRNPVGLVNVGRCSGIEDGERMRMTRAPKVYIGTVMEITHNGREPSGKFRHPQFSRFRPDKNAKDCVYDQEET